MRPLMAIVFISILLTVFTSTVKQSILEKQKSADRKIEEINIQKTLLERNQNISSNLPVQSPRLLQTIDALNNFISSLSGQLYFPVTGSGFNMYGTSNSPSADLGAQLLNSVPTPPQFNLNTPQSITGFGPQASSNTTRQVTFVNASQILGVLGPTNNTSSPFQLNTPAFEQYGQSNNQQRNQNQNQNQQNTQSFWFSGVPQNNQRNQAQNYYQQVNVGNTGTRNNNNNNQGASSVNQLNISELLSSGLSEDQISSVLSMQAQILNRNNNPVNLVPQPVNVTDFLRQQQPNTTTTIATTTSTSNISNTSPVINNFQQIPNTNNVVSSNSSQTTMTNIIPNRPVVQQNTSTTQSFVQSQSQSQTQPQTQTNLIASQQAQTATQQLLAQQEAQRERLAIIQQQQLQQQRQQQLQQQRQQQLQQQQTQTTVTTTTQSTNSTGQSVTLSQQQINRIIQAQSRLQSINQSVTTTNTSSRPQTIPPTTTTSNVQTTTNIVQTPVTNIATTSTTTTSSSSQPNAQMCVSYSSGVCVSCRSGSYLAQGFCYVPVTETGCSVFSQSQCIICKSRFYLIQNQCFQVDPRCSNFDYGNKVCVSCTNGTSRRGTGCA